MKRRAVAFGVLGAALSFVAAAYAQQAGQSLPPKLGQAPAPPMQNQRPQLHVLTSPSVASPMLLLPETSNRNSGLSDGGSIGDQPAPQSGSTNLYSNSTMQPSNSRAGVSGPALQGQSSALPASDSASSHSNYNPRPFLTAMLQLRLTANSCEQYLPTSPDDATKQIVEFFTSLQRPTPTGTLKNLSRSIDMLIRSQAASVCQDRMNKAIVAYQGEARAYDEKKPKAWPGAPVIKEASWCSTPNCIEVK
jgi:hypothetical protein